MTAIASGGEHALALRTDGTVWAWGRNIDGELGNGTNTSSNVPLRVTALSDVAAIAAGRTHSLALTGDGTLWAIGRNEWGQLGNGAVRGSTTPVEVTAAPVPPVANTLLGAKLALFADESDAGEFSSVRDRIEHVPLAADPQFQEIFVASMAFPAGRSAGEDRSASR